MIEPDRTPVRIRQGSIQPVFGAVTAEPGDTVEIQPGGLFTLYQPDGTPVAALNGVPASGSQNGPQQKARIWQMLETNPLAPGVYRGLFHFQVVFSGRPGEAQTLQREIAIDILPIALGGATYVASELERSPLFQVRLYAADTDTERPIWSDAELNFYLYKAGGIPRLAAADALESLALDRARMAGAVRIGAFGASEEEAYRAISERADRLRRLAPVMPSIHAPDPVFVLERRGKQGPAAW